MCGVQRVLKVDLDRVRFVQGTGDELFPIVKRQLSEVYGTEIHNITTHSNKQQPAVMDVCLILDAEERERLVCVGVGTLLKQQ